MDKISVMMAGEVTSTAYQICAMVLDKDEAGRGAGCVAFWVRTIYPNSDGDTSEPDVLVTDYPLPRGMDPREWAARQLNAGCTSDIRNWDCEGPMYDIAEKLNRYAKELWKK